MSDEWWRFDQCAAAIHAGQQRAALERLGARWRLVAANRDKCLKIWLPQERGTRDWFASWVDQDQHGRGATFATESDLLERLPGMLAG